MTRKVKAPFKYLVKAVDKKIKELEVIVKKFHDEAPEVYVTYDLNRARALGTCATMQAPEIGRPCYSHIKLNPALLNELKQPYIDEVFVHEYCHACAEHFFGKGVSKKIKPHGKEFKYFCRMFGIPQKATTNIAINSRAMKESGRRQKRHLYVCSCMTHEFTTRRHNMVQKGRRYYCRKCGHWITQPRMALKHTDDLGAQLTLSS